VAVEADDLLVVRCVELPRVAVERPVVGPLDLDAVLERLLEDAEVVPDPVADGRNVQCGHRVQQARGEPAQAAVAEAGLDVESRQRAHRQPARGRDLPGPRLGAGVEEVLAQLLAQQVLGRQVVDEPRVRLVVRGHRAGVPVDEPVPDRDRERGVRVQRAGRLDRRATLEVQVAHEVLLEVLDRGADPADFGAGLDVGHASSSFRHSRTFVSGSRY